MCQTMDGKSVVTRQEEEEELGEGASCLSGEGEFGRGDLGGVLMYELVMVAL